FDVRSILDDLMRGGPAPRRPPAAPGAPAHAVGGGPAPAGGQASLGAAPSRDRLADGDQTRASDPARAPSGRPAPGPRRPEDMLRNALGSGRQAGGMPGGGTSLGDLLKTLEQQAGQGRGGALEVVRQVLGQAAAGVREGSERLDRATGASQASRAAIEQMTG